MRYRAELLILLACVACGGHSVSSEPAPATKPDLAGTTAGTGSTTPTPTPSNGGSTTMSEPGPQPEPDPQPVCTGPQPVCVPDCTSKNRTVADCIGPQYQCPMGWVDLDSCSKDACARASMTCCSATGQPDYPECGANGLIGDCAAGSRQTSVCVPEGLGITDCEQIEDGTACPSADTVCLRDRCGLNCYCNADDSGALHWQCWVNLC